MITLNSKSKKLLLLQRNNLFSSRQVWLRKKFGRFIFTNFLINFFQNKNLEEITENLFKEEMDIIKNYLPNNATNISSEPAKVQAICNAAWTDDVKTAYKSFIESSE